jgi:hypothetical protein
MIAGAGASSSKVRRMLSGILHSRPPAARRPRRPRAAPAPPAWTAQRPSCRSAPGRSALSIGSGGLEVRARPPSRVCCPRRACAWRERRSLTAWSPAEAIAFATRFAKPRAVRYAARSSSTWRALSSRTLAKAIRPDRCEMWSRCGGRGRRVHLLAAKPGGMS